jgi:hypothetical protein
MTDYGTEYPADFGGSGPMLTSYPEDSGVEWSDVGVRNQTVTPYAVMSNNDLNQVAANASTSMSDLASGAWQGVKGAVGAVSDLVGSTFGAVTETVKAVGSTAKGLQSVGNNLVPLLLIAGIGFLGFTFLSSRR